MSVITADAGSVTFRPVDPWWNKERKAGKYYWPCVLLQQWRAGEAFAHNGWNSIVVKGHVKEYGGGKSFVLLVELQVGAAWASVHYLGTNKAGGPVLVKWEFAQILSLVTCSCFNQSGQISGDLKDKVKLWAGKNLTVTIRRVIPPKSLKRFSFKHIRDAILEKMLFWLAGSLRIFAFLRSRRKCNPLHIL